MNIGHWHITNTTFIINTDFVASKDSISIDQIITLATKAIGMEWEILAYLLGFTKPEVDRFQLDYPNKVMLYHRQ